MLQSESFVIILLDYMFGGGSCQSRNIDFQIERPGGTIENTKAKVKTPCP